MTIWKSAALAAAGACALALAACDNGPSAVEKTEARAERPSYEERFEREAGGGYAARDAEVGERGGERRASAEEAPLYAGKPLWSVSRRGGAEENARRAFERNGEAIGAKDYEDFLRKVHGFVGDPPRGTETLERRNGDVLLYHAASNTFAVRTRDGAPRTLFKPDEGAAYWAEQKSREAARRERRASGGSDGDRG